ncbi:MAG: bifunctional DNA-formamidopyrimidine glycosylase/DNA-(apurinic or apyrimidinic site) lyase [Patescibacteria group bacterium]|jgi:formamidopyrimidine-DNA glycosylase
MPELPEVETVVRGLSRHIVGQKIKHIHIPAKTSFKGTAKMAEGLKIKKITRRGKGIIIDLAKDQTILVHLKMTGQLIYVPSLRGGKPTKQSGLPRYARNDEKRLNYGHPTDDFTNTMPSKHTRVWFELSKGNLYFNDQRRFGWVKSVATKDALKDKFFAGLGVEPFDTKFTPAFLYVAIQRRPKSNIKAIILDQSLVTGIGNIYSDEALFYARIRPTRLGRSITKPDSTRLVGAIKKVLTKGIKYSGTSINTHRTPEGSMGRMQGYLAVYDRKGLPCRGTCKGKVEKIRLNGRGTHFCPSCQK